MDIYEKIDINTLQITSKRTMPKTDLLKRRAELVQYVKETEDKIKLVDEQLAVLNKEATP